MKAIVLSEMNPKTRTMVEGYLRQERVIVETAYYNFDSSSFICYVTFSEGDKVDKFIELVPDVKAYDVTLMNERGWSYFVSEESIVIDGEQAVCYDKVFTLENALEHYMKNFTKPMPDFTFDSIMQSLDHNALYPMMVEEEEDGRGKNRMFVMGDLEVPMVSEENLISVSRVQFMEDLKGSTLDEWLQECPDRQANVNEYQQALDNDDLYKMVFVAGTTRMEMLFIY
jgi:hypothetical protein